MRDSVRIAATAAFGVIAVLVSASGAAALTIPYSQDFESIAAGGSLPDATIGTVTATTNTWSVVLDGGGNHLYQNTLSATGSAKGFSSLQFTNLGPASSANNFEISTVLTPVSVAVPGSINYTAGLRFLGTNSGITDDCFVTDLNLGVNGGRMRLVEFTGASAVVYPSPTQTSQPLVPAFSISKSYLMDVKGTYDASNALTVNFTVTEVGAPANTQTYAYTVDTTPRTGQYFGLYDSFGSGGSSMLANYDNLSVVPEPSCAALLGTIALALFARRRGRPVF
jgi:hypothetical protein